MITRLAASRRSHASLGTSAIALLTTCFNVSMQNDCFACVQDAQKECPASPRLFLAKESCVDRSGFSTQLRNIGGKLALGFNLTVDPPHGRLRFGLRVTLLPGVSVTRRIFSSLQRCYFQTVKAIRPSCHFPPN